MDELEQLCRDVEQTLFQDVYQGDLGYKVRAIEPTWDCSEWVVVAMRDKGFSFSCNNVHRPPHDFEVTFWISGGGRPYSATAHTLPEAVFRAALAAKEQGDAN